ncbi:MAG: hypothetical protein OT477_07725 [Chloroflexi bacterium]|nr:hypothetical protein [Chloroflexota bacterium]
MKTTPRPPLVLAATAVLLLLTTLFTPSLQAGGGLIYVNHAATGSNNGTDWDNAYTDLQDALAGAIDGSEIWVAQGVYTPGNTADDSFHLLSDVALYGGFAATETLRTQRDWVANVTVLSGDIGGDDIADSHGVVTTTAHLTGTNSAHVVTAEFINNATLDGFTITAGNATTGNPVCPNACGGGLRLDDAKPTLANLVISGNAAHYGGGLHISFDSQPILQNVIIQGNSALLNGGGLLSGTESAPTLYNALITGNAAGASGGGIFNAGGNAALVNITLSGNWAGVRGGGMANRQGSEPSLINSIIWHNEDASGLGTLTANLDNNADSLPFVRYSLVQESGGSGLGWASNAGVDNGQNIAGNPLFEEPVDPAEVPTTAGNFQLQLISPAVDKGLQIVNPLPFDVAGNVRIQNGAIDMGAYESPPASVATAVFAGTGHGRITSSPAGVDCTTTCATPFNVGQIVTLTAETTTAESNFVGWSGVCSGTGTCFLELNTSETVTATFTLNQYELAITKIGVGSGLVTSTPAGLNCGATCTADFDFGTEVTLTATADTGFAFRGWSGACSGVAPVCIVTVEEAQTVTANFGLKAVYLPLISTP